LCNVIGMRMTQSVNFPEIVGDARPRAAQPEDDIMRVQIEAELVDFTLIGARISEALPCVCIRAVSDEGIEIVIEVPLVRFVMAARTMVTMAGTFGELSVP
jgi:hypothetical protein